MLTIKLESLWNPVKLELAMNSNGLRQYCQTKGSYCDHLAIWLPFALWVKTGPTFQLTFHVIQHKWLAAAFQAINLGKMYKGELCMPLCWPKITFSHLGAVWLSAEPGWWSTRTKKIKNKTLTNGLHVCFHRPAKRRLTWQLAEARCESHKC